MGQIRLKSIRIILAFLFFLPIIFLFVDFKEFIPTSLTSYILYLQFVPSLLKFLGLLSLVSAGFLLIVITTFLFGRIYCSTICPLGIFQDIISRISLWIRKKRRYRFSKAQHVLRYIVFKKQRYFKY